MRTKFTIKKRIGLSNKINYLKNLSKYKNFNGEKFHLFLNKELKTCVIADIAGFPWVPRIEIGQKRNNKTL